LQDKVIAGIRKRKGLKDSDLKEEGTEE